ncbi:MAG: two-component regulator propeller domain-containing protein, partial [bacterium]
MKRRMAHIGLGLAVLAAAGLPAWASPPWYIRSWQSDAGLPDNTVVAIGQTPDGFLWVAAQTGLVRFDGVEFRQVPVPVDGMPAGLVHALLVDRRGRLWVAKECGALVCVDQGRPTTVIAPDHGRTDRRVRMLVEDAEGAVWVLYVGGDVLRIHEGR